MSKRSGHRPAPQNAVQPPAISRRRFVAGSAAVAAGLALVGGAGWHVLQAGRKPRCQPLFLSPERFECLRAACDRVLPADVDGGAAAIGAAAYIDRLLAQDEYTGNFLKWRPILVSGLDGIEALARQRRGRGFVQLSEPDRDAILAAYQDPAFLPTLVEATLDGVFYDPFYGGNRDAAGWRLVGFWPSTPWAVKHLRQPGATQRS